METIDDLQFFIDIIKSMCAYESRNSYVPITSNSSFIYQILTPLVLLSSEYWKHVFYLNGYYYSESNGNYTYNLTKNDLVMVVIINEQFK